MENLTSTLMNITTSPEQLLVLGVGVGTLLTFIAVATMLRDRNPAAARIARSGQTRAQVRRDHGLLQAADADPRGLLKKFVPADNAKRTALHLKLAQAGYSSRDALKNFIVARIFFGLLLPGLFLGLLAVRELPDVVLPAIVDIYLARLSGPQIVGVLLLLTAAGYFLPVKWLSDKIEERKTRIEHGFPNALDLLQISIEAGLGFDAAMTRVGNELAEISPDVAFEFLSVQRQIQAGRPRNDALQDMADRTGIDTVRSFANVVQQSLHFGTSMSDALATYSAEMRDIRESKAQEMANKLPVKMSAVLASIMLPALIMLTVGPVVIRYVRYFAG